MAGSWETVATNDWPPDLIAVHMIHLHTGVVLLWPFGAANPPRTPEVYLWNPNDRANYVNVPNDRTDLFCAGHCQLEDGRAITAGGNFLPSDPPLLAPFDVNIFDPLSDPISDAWQNGTNPPADMNFRRYYPTCTALPDGRIMAFSGKEETDPGPPQYDKFAKTPEVYLPAKDTWSPLPDADLLMPFYPYMFVMPNGHLFFAGLYTDTKELDPVTLIWSDVLGTPSAGGESGSAVMYDIGKVLKSGGNFSPHPAAAIKAAAVINLNDNPPQWSSVPDMNKERRHHNLVALPDGTVLAVGGVKYGQDADRNKAEKWPAPEPVFEPEIFNPDDGTWGLLLAAMPSNHPRWYHSTALLLPDARVLVAGGNASTGYDTANADIFSPPYLDGSPTRCIIQSAPSGIDYEDTFNVIVDKNGGTGVDKVSLLRLGAVTHSFDQNQRFIDLSFTTGPGPLPGTETLQVTPPANANDAPPGDYMLFVLTRVNSVLVPCETAAFIRISDGLDDAYPDGVSVWQGAITGDETDLVQSDNSYVVIGAETLQLPADEPKAGVEVTTTAGSFTALTFTLEAHTTDSQTQRIFLWNYQTSLWETIYDQTSSLQDKVFDVAVSGDPSRFIPSTGPREMKARIGWFAVDLPDGWQAKIDHVLWSLKPPLITP